MRRRQRAKERLDAYTSKPSACFPKRCLSPLPPRCGPSFSPASRGEQAISENLGGNGHENVPFWVLDGFVEISATLLERMAWTTRLELATSAVTANDQSVFQRLGKHGRHSKSLEGSSTRSCCVSRCVSRMFCESYRPGG